MGGKNCVIVDADADLDDAVPALAYSAFGFAGQKCSAARRALVHERIADTLLERLHGAVEALLVDQAQRFGVDVPPVIEPRGAGARRGYLQIAQRGGRARLPARRGARARLLRRPRGGRRPAARLRASPRRRSSARCSPSSACGASTRRATIVADQPFALTGGLFSRDPATVDRVSRRLPVGNLYVNRHITGAMVARQPFGGNRLSGTGTKAGGPDYLLHFVEPRVVTEDTMRHGLVV